ncbi:MAG TPA: hypothetical protein VN158_08210 [Caulobacter sp.]|nr:hypothetical protein [Caulobacter sp.]
MARRTLQGLELHDRGRTYVLTPTAGLRARDCRPISWLEALELFNDLWLSPSTLWELRLFWARERPSEFCTPTPHMSVAELRKAILAMLAGGHATLGVKTGGLTAEQLKAIMPNALLSDINAALGPLNTAMDKHGIDSAPKRAAFLAQLSVESQQLSHTVESLRYTHAERLKDVFGSKYFPTVDSAKPYVKNAEKLANYVYGSKNGNNQPGDGWAYRGRGYIQVTGRANYRDVGYEANPDALLTPTGAADSAAAYWEKRKLNEASATWLDRPQFDRVTGKVNAKKLEATARWQAYQRAKKALSPK